MKGKNNNELVLVTIGGHKEYFNDMKKAGQYVGLAAESVKWAIKYNSVLKNDMDEDITFTLVDGSEIPYKYIND